MGQVTIPREYKDQVSLGPISAIHSVDGRRVLRYHMTMFHRDLALQKDITAPEIFMLQFKVTSQMLIWSLKLKAKEDKEAIASGRDLADEITNEAAARLDILRRILSQGLAANPKIVWSDLLENAKYKAEPFRLNKPTLQLATQPSFVEPQISFWSKLTGKAPRVREQAENYHKDRLAEWSRDEEARKGKYGAQLREWDAAKALHDARIDDERRRFEDEQAASNRQVNALERDVQAGKAAAIQEQMSMVLEKSNYHGLFEKLFVIEYVADTKTLMVEYSLPSPDTMPTLKVARFIAKTGELKETHISERDKKSNYDSACYQIALRTIYEVLTSDESRNIHRVLFNGITTYIDNASGRDTTSCIMSIMVKREEFEGMDLSRVDPKACFKSLKGVSASSLAALASVAPVMNLSREDRRFIDARPTADTIDDATNLASMDWEDFEHLVREVFEKEFMSRGGEVRVTQSSNDGGVDAVAFDPDPITGGKFIIQAKRYTRTVGVSAVRDLYGTMQHEAASRGILVTTADYGPDAYSFATNKPITLMTGANLLHLLGKHGIRAKIDLRDARKVMNLRDYGKAR